MFLVLLRQEYLNQNLPINGLQRLLAILEEIKSLLRLNFVTGRKQGQGQGAPCPFDLGGFLLGRV